MTHSMGSGGRAQGGTCKISLHYGWAGLRGRRRELGLVGLDGDADEESREPQSLGHVLREEALELSARERLVQVPEASDAPGWERGSSIRVS